LLIRVKPDAPESSIVRDPDQAGRTGKVLGKESQS
jgi:hypothetical protein